MTALGASPEPPAPPDRAQILGTGDEIGAGPVARGLSRLAMIAIGVVAEGVEIGIATVLAVGSVARRLSRIARGSG